MGWAPHAQAYPPTRESKHSPGFVAASSHGRHDTPDRPPDHAWALLPPGPRTGDASYEGTGRRTANGAVWLLRARAIRTHYHSCRELPTATATV